MKAVVIVALALATSPAFAVYKCKSPGGGVVFQDSPCAGGGGKIDVRPASGAPRADAPGSLAGKGSDSQGQLERLQQQAETSARERRIREIGFEIRDAEAGLQSLDSQMTQEMAGIRNQKRYANNNLAGATWEASLSQEMEAAARKYQARMENERARITRLEQERERLLGQK